MSLKDEVLRMLEDHRGEALSGESVAERLSVSRASVWKAVRALSCLLYTSDAADEL